MHRIIYTLLLLCLPLYGFSMQDGLPHAYGPGSFAHEVEHGEAVYHHHKEDGSVHYDQSEESLDHAQEHSPYPQPDSLSVSSLTVPPEQQVSGLAPFIARAVAEPFLDGPRKPPRHSLGQAAEGTLHI